MITGIIDNRFDINTNSDNDIDINGDINVLYVLYVLGGGRAGALPMYWYVLYVLTA